MSETPTGSAISESILLSVRPMCNVDKDDDGFDEKLIPLINAQLMIAHHEIGIGVNGFNITGPDETWAEWLGAGETRLAAAKTWLGQSVLLQFDPPDNATMAKTLQESVNKTAWMLASKSKLEGHTKTIYPVEYVEED